MDYSFIRKYRPRNLKEYLNQEEAVRKAKELVEGKTKKKALLLYGPPGIGKTALVYAIAGSYDLEVVEVNASNSRDAKSIKGLIGEAIRQKSFFHKGKIILIDEIDGISGREDRGAIPELVKTIKISPYPIILTANDPWDKKFNSLRKEVELIEMQKLSISIIKKGLKKIAKREGIEIDDDALNIIARSGGDLRAAINDLELLKGKKISIKDTEVLGYREREVKIFEALTRIFKSMSIETSMGAFDYVDMDIDEIFLWLEKNIPYQYKNIEDISHAFDMLSLADIYNSRTKKRGYYRLWFYAYFLMSCGIALAKKEKYEGFLKIKKPTRILKIWMAKKKYEKEKESAEKIAKECHISVRRALRDIVPFTKHLKI